ncbi:MAG: hypothetical protein KME36_00180 [Candidatus Thiodiazotropha sp. (ex Lucina pensylvanica)]|nr:hypothetical protein [Candidatus Thiodiazotropha sp. (ex Lucina pensylvanica)]MBT3052426.1 hypothetical protein [Candidatus Thiodiazotropha sp. (ex Codakia orbicularis)]
MGLHVHSLDNIPYSDNRDYLIYLLEYGWHEPLAKALNDNFDKMANIAAKSRAVIIRGTELAHFENEVFSWHNINNERGEDVLPAILITNAHPSYFLENSNGYTRKRGGYRESDTTDLKLILIPLKIFCTTTTEVINLLEKIFSDIGKGLDLSDFSVAKEVKKGVGAAVVDSIILEPNISGVGFSFKKLINYLREK